MFKIVRTVSSLLLTAALCSGGTVYAADNAVTSVTATSQQQKTLKGTVNDAFGPLVGVSVVVKGTTNGVVTDLDGNFTLNVNEGDILQISFIGYATQEIKYTGQPSLTVKLQEDTQLLEEVVVVGYGTQKKVNMTGSVAQVDSKMLESRPIQNLSTGIQGLMPGVTVVAGSGLPGQDGGTIRVRGVGTLNSAESRVRLAELNAKQGETDFSRVEKLFEDKLVSREDYEKAEVSVKQAREELQTAKDNLEIVKEGITKNSASFSSTLIRSTIDGLILDVPVKAGNSVIMSNTFNDGTTIATVANMNDLIFRGKIDETEVGRVHEGMPVKLTIGALQNLSFDATLEYISPKGVEENGANQFEIKAAIQVPDTVMIRSGYSANAEIVLERAQKALTLPESTIEFSGDSTFVYVMTDSVPAQKFERKEVKVGMSDGIKIVIKDGVDGKSKVRGAEKKDK